jgi:glycosyltransferase involved in cell wall biosynthesis
VEDDGLGMKILMVHNRYELKGGEDAVFESECSLLRRRGHEVVEYLEDNRSIKEQSRVSAAAAAIWSRRAHRGILRILEQGSFDIAHFHNIFLRVSPSAYYSCNKLGIPVVQTLHNYRLLCPSAELYRAGGVCESCLGKRAPWPAIWHACYRKSRLETSLIASILTLHNLANTWHRLIDRYIALTDFARTKFAEGGIPSRKISVKPNFVFPDPGMGDGQGDYALFVGRLTEQKGIKTLLNAWERLLHIPLRVVGEGPLADYVRRYSENGNL